jgi:molecular chaperone DnaJ
MLDSQAGKGRSIRTTLLISLEEGAAGGAKTIQFSRFLGCECTRIPVNPNLACPHCGSSRVRSVEERVRVAWPAGVVSGSRFICAGAGDASDAQQTPGDLIVEVQIRSHSFLRRVGSDCHMELPLCFSQATLGCTLRIPSLYGHLTLTVPPGTQCHASLVVPGFGFPAAGTGTGTGAGGGGVRGNMVVRVVVQVPHGVSPEDAALLRRFDRNVRQRMRDLEQAGE